MAYRLSCTKPFSDQVLIHCQMIPLATHFNKIWIKLIWFSTKYILNLQNVYYFCLGFNVKFSPEIQSTMILNWFIKWLDTEQAMNQEPKPIKMQFAHAYKRHLDADKGRAQTKHPLQIQILYVNRFVGLWLCQLVLSPNLHTCFDFNYSIENYLQPCSFVGCNYASQF